LCQRKAFAKSAQSYDLFIISVRQGSIKWSRIRVEFTTLLVMIGAATTHVPSHSLANTTRDFRTVQFEQNLDFLKSGHFSSQLSSQFKEEISAPAFLTFPDLRLGN